MKNKKPLPMILRDGDYVRMIQKWLGDRNISAMECLRYDYRGMKANKPMAFENMKSNEYKKTIVAIEKWGN